MSMTTPATPKLVMTLVEFSIPKPRKNDADTNGPN